MRNLLVLLALAGISCTTNPTRPAAEPGTAAAIEEPSHGLTIEEEAAILALEDRREFDPVLVRAWATHPNPLHRHRIAMALGRIGPHTFIDTNNNRERDTGERQAGVESLISMSRDPDANVRTTVAFALGEIGDKSSIDVLFALSADANASVAAEAAEALSKMAADVPLARYTALTSSPLEGVRARAIRYLFRFNNDEASALAASILDSGSPTTRQEAAYTLARRAYAPARERLELLLADTDPQTRAYVVAALGRIAARESAQPLIRMLADVHPWVRTNTAVALSRIAAKDASFVSVETVPRVLALTEDADSGTRANSIELLGYYAAQNSTARQRLLDIASNGTRWERELAAAAIARQFGDTEPGLLPGEMSGWAKVRVLEQLAQLPKSGPGLRRRFAADTDPMVRANAVGNIPDDAVDTFMDLIRPALEAEDPIVRGNALDRYALAKSISDEAKIATLRAAERRAAGDRENDARIAAIRGLASFDHPERESFLRGLLADNDPVVRRIAADLLVEKLDRNRPQYTPLPVTADYAAIARWARQPHRATIHMTRGVIELVLLPQEAPRTTWNFAQLAAGKYFDNTTFMRVVPNFVVQGGDPRNDQSGGPGYAIRDEINLQKYTRGAVGMALSGPDTGGSQFFITHSPQPHLDGGYTIFARVTAGMSAVVDQTERGDRVETIVIDGMEARAPSPAPESIHLGRAETGFIAALPGYAQARTAYRPDDSIVELIAEAIRPEDRVEVYMGTWCSDSLREIPRFLRITDIVRDKHAKTLPMSFVGVDRSKTKPEDLLAGKSITKVPTFIFYRGDREIGRIEEAPDGPMEDHVLRIVAK